MERPVSPEEEDTPGGIGLRVIVLLPTDREPPGVCGDQV
jgi:hypothetical protein